MCGRFSRYIGEIIFFDLFPVTTVLTTPTVRYNIAPRSMVPVIDKHFVLRDMLWGFGDAPHPINARSERVDTRYKEIFGTSRCIIPASGFYEWKEGQAYHIRSREREGFGMGGICKRFENRMTFAIMTTEATPEMQDIHDRMPVIIPAGDERKWLRGTVSEVKRYLRPSNEDLWFERVGDYVNSPRHEGPECIRETDQLSLDSFF